LAAIFGGPEPLRNAERADQFRALLGTLPDRKPFECVGDIDECRAAIILSAARPDRAGDALVQRLAAEAAGPQTTSPISTTHLMAAIPPDAIPHAYSPESVVV
jgi:hypothetical protein